MSEQGNMDKIILLTVSRKSVKRPVLVNAVQINWAEALEHSDQAVTPGRTGTLIYFSNGQKLVVEEGLAQVIELWRRPELSLRRNAAAPSSQNP